MLLVISYNIVVAVPVVVADLNNHVVAAAGVIFCLEDKR